VRSRLAAPKVIWQASHTALPVRNISVLGPLLGGLHLARQLCEDAPRNVLEVALVVGVIYLRQHVRPKRHETINDTHVTT